MSSFKIELKGFKEVIEKLSVDRYKKDINKALFKFGINVDRDAKQMAPTDEGQLKRSIFYDIGDLEVTVGANVDYAAFVEFGTRKFAAEYVSSLPPDWQTFAAQFRGGSGGTFQELIMRIKEWAKRKGIDDNAAYVIARKIVIDGKRPQPFLYPAVEKNRPQLLNEIQELINK